MGELYNGDYKDILNTDNIRCDIVVTDPPYLFEKGGNSKMLGDGDALHRKKRTMLNSEFGEDQIYEFMDITKSIMNKPQWYIFCSEKQLPYYLKWCTENSFIFNLLVWCKPLTVLNRNRYSTNIEYIVRIYNYGCPLNKLEQDKSKLYSKWKTFDIIRGKQKQHPQQKPIELLQEIIEVSTNEGDVVLDCFMGSGSTGVSCLKNGRKFIGIEKDGNFYQIAKTRISEVLKNKDL